MFQKYLSPCQAWKTLQKYYILYFVNLEKYSKNILNTSSASKDVPKIFVTLSSPENTPKILYFILCQSRKVFQKYSKHLVSLQRCSKNILHLINLEKYSKPTRRSSTTRHDYKIPASINQIVFNVMHISAQSSWKIFHSKGRTSNFLLREIHHLLVQTLPFFSSETGYALEQEGRIDTEIVAKPKPRLLISCIPRGTRSPG